MQIREEPPPYTSPGRRSESFDNPMMGSGSQSFESSQDEERVSSGNPQHGSALYDFTAGGDDEVCSTSKLLLNPYLFGNI